MECFKKFFAKYNNLTSNHILMLRQTRLESSARLAWFRVWCYMRECVCRHPSCIVKFHCTLRLAPHKCIALKSLLVTLYILHISMSLFYFTDKVKIWKICSFGSIIWIETSLMKKQVVHILKNSLGGSFLCLRFNFEILGFEFMARHFFSYLHILSGNHKVQIFCLPKCVMWQDQVHCGKWWRHSRQDDITLLPWQPWWRHHWGRAFKMACTSSATDANANSNCSYKKAEN